MIKKLSSETIETIISNKSLVSYTHIIKELIDNSIDAHSDCIVIKLFENGLERVEIVDNGTGVDKDELERLFDRSFTSKNVDNASIGFKGDALASLSTLAKVTFYSSGYMISKDREKLEDKIKSPDSPSKGSRIVVSDLFAGYPVRLKYLRNHIKQNITSLTKYIREMSLVYPHISFKLHSVSTNTNKRTKPDDGVLLDVKKTTNEKFNEKTIKPAIKSIKNRIADAYSIDMLNCLKEINSQNNEDITNFSFFGLFSQPGKTISRNCHLQRVYVNNNIAEFPKLIKLLNQFYKNSVRNSSNGYFFYIVNILVTNNTPDKFFSPLKDKVVLENEQQIIDSILSEIRSKVFKPEGNTHTNVTLSYSNFMKPVVSNSHNTTSNNGLDVEYKDFQTVSKNKETNKPIFNEITNIDNPSQMKENERICDTIIDIDEPFHEKTRSLDLNRTSIANFQIIGQFNSSFIVCKYEDSLVVLDQHASDEIVTYYKLLKENKHKRTLTKGFLKKEVITIDRELIEVAKENISLLKSFGISVCNVLEEDGKVEIDSLSVLYSKDQCLNELEKILSNIKNGFIEEENLYPKSYLKEIASTACRSSIMIGDIVNQREMKRILHDLSLLDKPWNCPHGRPTMTLIKKFDSFE
eukprot:GAHX01002059.1.p1 GENE.GAHX01002059.1~~GAHX01002059.1.p1  ORF type:complete len:637 (+),score=111.22 GAHX01002059.1:38-1948(+)